MATLIGVDVGGTFTDIVVWESESRRVWLEKVLTTPDDPSRGTVAGTRAVLGRAELPPSGVAAVRHGTTVATNTLIQRAGARTGLITTRGFRDVVEIGRTKRDVTFDLMWDRLPPLVRRRHRREVTERMSAGGESITPLDLRELELEFRFLTGEGIESIAVSFLNAYANAEHEKQAIAHLQSLDPGLSLTRGSEILPDLLEYERTHLAAINAYVAPLISRYLENLERELQGSGIEASVSVMQSNGGAMEIPYARAAPVRLLLSGPCAGVTGAIHLARKLGLDNLITFDMGGTSCDVCLVEGGVPQLTTSGSVAGYTLAPLPILDINTIGAGGGSLAWLDAGGALKVGPRSAGAVPGPACYGTGGERPTVTDAWIIAGYLNPDQLVGGALRLYPHLAERAVRRIAERLGLGLSETSDGVLRVVEANMVNAVKTVSVKRGRDPQHLVLVAYGGAGPLAAAGIARELGMRRVLVPRHPGLLCALGTLVAGVQYDVKRSFRVPLNRDALPGLEASLAELADGLRRHFGAGSRSNLVFSREAYLKYAGQYHSLPLPMPEVLTEATLPALRKEFDAAFERDYGHARPDQPVEFDSLRVVVCDRPADVPSFEPPAAAAVRPVARPRMVWIDEAARACPVFDWSTLGVGTHITGPAIVEEFDSTVWVPPDGSGRIVDDGSILLEL